MPQGPQAQNPAVNPSGVRKPLLVNSQGNLLVSTAPGNAYYVNETTGSDTNNGSQSSPFATLTAALAAATANNNDVIYLEGTVHVAATVAWNKANVSLVGLCAPSGNNRARISQTGSSVFSPLVLVSVENCSFENIATFHGFDDASAQICWEDSSGRNYYKNVDFLGMGHATAAAQAGSRSLLLSGNDGESVFDGCTIGLDTVVRATATNASLELTGGSPRNVFRNCIFRADVSDASDVHVLVGADGIDRNLTFDDCIFLNAVDSGGTAMTAAFSVDNAAGGSVVLNGGMSVGATAIAASGPVYVNGAVPTATTSSIGIKAT